MKQYDFRLDAGDKNAGTVYLPDSFSGTLPVVISCHGWQGSRTLNPSTRQLCASLLDASAAMVTLDFWGCGDTGGPYDQMSYSRWSSNLKDAFEWVRQQEWADSRKVGCFGISSGSTVALRVAEECHELAFVVSVATCLGLFMAMPNSPARVLVEHLGALLHGSAEEVFGTPFGLSFFTDFVANAPVYNLNAITCPVFFLQGADDNVWRRSDAWIGFQVMQESGLVSRHLEIQGGNHGLDNVPERCAQEVVSWLAQIGALPSTP